MRHVRPHRRRSRPRPPTPQHHGTLDPDLDAVLDDLARAIVNIATTVDPGRIVLGGLARAGSEISRHEDPQHRAHLRALGPALAAEQGPGIAALELARLHRTSHVR